MQNWLISCCFIFCFGFASNAQTLKSTEVDSLQQIIDTHPNDSVKCRAINKLAFHYIFIDVTKAASLIENGLLLATKSKQPFCQAELLNTKAIDEDIRGNKDSALYIYQQSHAISKKYGFKKLEILTFNGMGLLHWKSGVFDLALENFYEALRLNKKHFPESEESTANYISNIGLIHQELKQIDKAITYHKQALKIRQKLDLKNGEAVSYANLGVCYKNKQQFDSSAWYYSNAIQKAEQAQNWRMYYSLHDNMAELYASQQKNKIALSYYLKAINRPEGIAGNPKSDISTFANIANLYLQQNDILNALHYAALGKKLIQKYPQIEVFAADLFYTEAVSYFMQGDKTAGMQSMNKYKQVSDSIFSEKNATALAQYEAKYEIAEKNKLLLEQEILLQQQKISMQRITIALLVILAGIIALAGYFFYAFKKKQQDAKQAELYLALAKQKEITQLQEERLRISRELHDNIGSHLTLISATAEHIENTASNEKVEGLKNMLRKTTQELRKTVWLLNKQRITIDEVIIKLREYLKPLQHSDCKVEINYNGDGQVMLSDIQTTQLFRIIQEAVNNAIKYASCSIIQIELNIDEYKIMSFSIKDNGTGFDPERTLKGGGIRNMNYRIGLLNGALTLSSTKNEGTVIVGSFNI